MAVGEIIIYIFDLFFSFVTIRLKLCCKWMMETFLPKKCLKAKVWPIWKCFLGTVGGKNNSVNNFALTKENKNQLKSIFYFWRKISYYRQRQKWTNYGPRATSSPLRFKYYSWISLKVILYLVKKTQASLTLKGSRARMW